MLGRGWMVPRPCCVRVALLPRYRHRACAFPAVPDGVIPPTAGDGGLRVGRQPIENLQRRHRFEIGQLAKHRALARLRRGQRPSQSLGLGDTPTPSQSLKPGGRGWIESDSGAHSHASHTGSVMRISQQVKALNGGIRGRRNSPLLSSTRRGVIGARGGEGAGQGAAGIRIASSRRVATRPLSR